MDVVLRSIALFSFVFFVMRIVGRKELSGLSAFELVLLIVMGDLIQQGVTGDDRSVVGAMLAVSTFALMVVALSWTSFRSSKARQTVEGRPVVVVQDGRPLEKIMKLERLTLDEVKDAAREQGIPDLRDVRIGVFEADGKFSFLRSSDWRPQQQPEQQQ